MKYQKIINLIDDKISDAIAKLYDRRITIVSKSLQQNNSGTFI